MSLRALIVDDEPPARSKIRKLLEREGKVEVVGEAADGVEAIERALELRPDLLFLDIQMPRADGFDVLREIYPQVKPMIIFTTAYDQYAIRAFEVEALDYLLKPFTSARLNEAVERAMKRKNEQRDMPARLARLLENWKPSTAPLQRILVRNQGAIYFVPAREIEWIEAEEKYVLLHTRGQSHMVRQNISSLEDRLKGAGFVRIHRSYLIQLEALQQLANSSHGDYVAVLKSGVRLNVGRNYRETLLAAMGSDPATPSEGSDADFNTSSKT
jgi:two-component system LytT family response regulator